MHRNLVNFTYPQDKQFSPMLLRGLNLFADRFTRTSVLRVMSHASLGIFKINFPLSYITAANLELFGLGTLNA